MSSTLLAPKPAKRISLTPLIDVVFILLMFFMLTSTFNQWKAIDLVSGAASEKPLVSPTDVTPQFLILHHDGLLSLKGAAGSASAFEHVDIKTIMPALTPHKTVVVFPEAQAKVQTIVATLEGLKAAGAEAITLGNSLPNTASLKNGSSTSEPQQNTLPSPKQSTHKLHDAQQKSTQRNTVSSTAKQVSL